MPIDHARLTELFTEAVELEGDARDALIARVRTEDAALATELAGLLAADLGAGDVLHTAMLQLPAEPPRATELRIPGYRIGERLGEGGMGTVYAGEQLSPPRPVAIKILHVSSGPALARFWTEAEIMARLDHPGIARVLESGDADGHPFIAMERVTGATLDRYVRDTGAPTATRLRLFAAICDAVHHAHLNGVIHRDLKPTNVMVRDDGRIAVLDFGIARADGASSGATRAGELIGTPLYMSPEQASLRADEVDARADVYSLGVTLHELIAGELPYPIRGMTVGAVRAIICNDAPSSLRSLGYDRDLDAIVANALAKDPRDRYQSAAALADDLRRHLDGRAVSVRTPSTIELVRRFARRRPAMAAAIASAIALTLTFAIVVTRLWLDARAARERSEVARLALAARTADLTLQQARAIVANDPTAALALLDDVRGNPAIDAWAVDVVASEARGRGVAAKVLRGHRDEVHWVEQLGDHSVVTGSYDGTVRLWTPSLDDSRVIFHAARGRIHDARPSPDGALFAIGGDAGALHVVDREGHIRDLTGHLGDVERAVWSADGAWLATGDDRGGTFVWPRGAAPGRPLAGPAAKIEALAFSGDGHRVVAGDDDGIVWTWSLATGEPTRLPTGDRGGVRAVWCGGDVVTAVTADGSLRTWRAGVAAPAIESHVPTRRAEIRGTTAVIAGAVGAVVRIEDGAIESLGMHASMVRGLAVGHRGTRIASGGEDGVIQVWDRATGRHVTLRGHRQRIRQLAFSADDAVLYSADGEGVVRVWQLDAIPPTFFVDHGAPIEHLATDGRILASSDDTGLVVVTDLATGGTRAVGRSAAHVTALAVAGGDVVSGDVAGNVTWWRATPLRVAAGSNVHAIAADRDRIAVATEAGPIVVFASDGTKLATLAGHEGGSEAVSFSRDGLLASGGQDRSIRLWRDGRAVGELAGPTGDTYFVRFAPSGDALVSAGDDGKVRAWRVVGEVASQPRIVGSHVGAVTAIAIDATGHYVASAGRDAAITRGSLADAAPFASIEIGNRGSLGISIDRHGDVLVASANGDVEHWDAQLAAISAPTTTAAAAPLASGIVLGGLDGSLRVLSQP